MRHLPIGGSTIARTIQCPSWSKNINKKIKKPAGSAANLGNLLHDAMENYYQDGKLFEDQLGKTKFADLTLVDDHLSILYKMYYQVETILDKYNISDFICEPFVQYIEDEAGGSIDMIGISEDGTTAIILDYKTGRVAVEATENKQLYFYTLCANTDKKTAYLLEGVTRFVSVIVQPYVYDEPDEFIFDMDKLNSFKIEVDNAIALTKTDNPPTVAGSHCAFCPKSAICSERRAYAQTAYMIDSKDRKSLSESLQLAMDLKSWCDEVIETAKHVASEGVTIPGFKRVAGRNTRVWEDEGKALAQLETDLKENAYNKKLLSPAQAIKAIKEKGLSTESYDNLIALKAAKPMIVKDSDKRESLSTNNLCKNLNKFFTNKP